MTRRESEPGLATAPASDLAQLVAIEQGLEQRLAEARREARSLVEQAGAASDAEVEQFEAGLAATRQERTRQLKMEQAEGERRALAEGQRKAAWYENLPAATQEQLAEYVVDRLLERGGP